MHATPYSNSVAVGTEGVKPLWHALDELTEAVILAQLVIAGAEPQPESMRRRAVEGFTPATELANRLVLGTGISFRSAHHVVGALVTRAAERGEPLAESAGEMFREHGLEADAAWLDPAAVAASAAYGGGPARASLRRIIGVLRAGWATARWTKPSPASCTARNRPLLRNLRSLPALRRNSARLSRDRYHGQGRGVIFAPLLCLMDGKDWSHTESAERVVIRIRRTVSF
jgi:argininosuccinate lyase